MDIYEDNDPMGAEDNILLLIIIGAIIFLMYIN
jgi:hypothetical protein